MKKTTKVTKKKIISKSRKVYTFDVVFTGMTEEDFEFLRKLAEDKKAAQAAVKESGSAKKK